MVEKRIQIVDRGRGLQLSTNRITVQDLVPYFQEGCSHQEIIRWIPALSQEELAVAEDYYREHQKELDEEDRVLRERTADAVHQQHLRFRSLEGTPRERMARLRQLLADRSREINGAGNPG